MKDYVKLLLVFVAVVAVMFVAIGMAPAVPTSVSGFRLILVALLPSAGVWGALAIRRAWLDDESRGPRVTRKAIARLLADIRRRDGTPTMAELERWRQLVVQLWKIDRAAPSPAEIAIRVGSNPAAAWKWAALWEEMEEAMFSPRGTVRDTWLARATMAAGEFRGARRAVPIPKLRRHWLPLTTAVVITLVGSTLDGADIARDAIERPDDWSARHNVARAYAQQEKWGTAAAHGTAAYLLNPRDPTVNADGRFWLGKIEAPDPVLVRLLGGPWYERAFGQLSPAQWERLAIMSAVVAGVGFTIAVMLLYFGQSARWRRAVLACALFGGAVAVVAFASVRRYGALANPQAAFVAFPAELRSIPSEIVARQQAVTLPPGTIVIVDRSFLGWDHVSAHGNVRGWIRTDAAVWLYRKRNHAQVSADYTVAARR